MVEKSRRKTFSESEIETLSEGFDIMSKKWMVEITTTFMKDRALLFKELRDSIDRISNKILCERLKQLENCGIIERDGKEYRITEKGSDLEPVFRTVLDWYSHDS